MKHLTVYAAIIPLVCLIGLVSVPGRLAPPGHDLAQRHAFWFWEGGRQLDRAAFAGMVNEVLEMMPVVPRKDGLVSLLSETAATETSFGRVVRDKSGKTLGVYQMILSTAEYLLDHLEQYPHVVAIVRGYMEPGRTLTENLTYNLHFQTAMAISYYWRQVGEDLPTQVDSLENRARLYKSKWNTRSGRATEAKYIRDSKIFLADSGYSGSQ
jgi:hypothetical protein